jgi:formylglycine-generating enzyme required for sulfatase activity
MREFEAVSVGGREPGAMAGSSSFRMFRSGDNPEVMLDLADAGHDAGHRDRMNDLVSPRLSFKTAFGAFVLALASVSTGAAEPLEVFRDCDVCPEMIELPLGEFVMGASDDEFRRNLVWRDGAHHRATPEYPFVKTDEGPQHRATVDIQVSIGRTEVTYDEWMACVNAGGCGGYIPQSDVYIDGGGGATYKVTGNHPVLHISYRDGLSYIDWLNEVYGAKVYRLPTEAEWEYTARAGTTTRFAQGNEITTGQANFHARLSEMILIEKHPDFFCHAGIRST